MSRAKSRTCIRGYSRSKIVHGWRDLSIKYFLFGGDVDENREHIKSSIFLSVQ